ncbi:MAG: DMT family transporter [Hyphomonadaceae bacterium]
MALRDFALLFAICLVWGLNLVLTRFVVTEVPPLFYAFIRFFLVAIVLIPFLRRPPKQWGWATLIGLCVGAGNFVLLFLALKNGTASSIAVAGQIGLPISTALSMIFLNEKVGWRRGLGMAMAGIGVVIIAYDPEEVALSLGVVLVICAAFVGSTGGIAMKKMDPIPIFEMQAWIALVSIPLPLALSLLWEENQIGAALEMGLPFYAALAFSVIGVSIFGHGSFYHLVKRYDVTLLTPLTLMTPVWAVFFGVVLLNEELSMQLALGAIIALSGVALIAVRPNLRFPDLAAFWRRPGA